MKYGELEAGKESVLRLFLSEANTNRALDSVQLGVKVVNQSALALGMTMIDTGIYELKGVFPVNGTYDLQVSINSNEGPDLLQVSKIEVGKKLEEETMEEHSHWYDHPLLWAVAGLTIGVLLMFLVMKRRNRKLAASIIVLGLLIPTATMNPGFAHEGEEHGAPANKGGGLSNAFLVEKESQFH